MRVHSFYFSFFAAFATVQALSLGQVGDIADTEDVERQIHQVEEFKHVGWHHVHSDLHKSRRQTQKSNYWLENVVHQGKAAFNPDPNNYTVFRNVKDFGAYGDGIHDDTAAINLAISSGNRCGPRTGNCNTTTTTPALIYFPSGTYLLSGSIIQYYITQLVGDATNKPVLKATANFTGLGLVDGDKYGADGTAWKPINIFFRQLRNFVLDGTNVPVTKDFTALHWPTSQATSMQNIDIIMTANKNSSHVGILMEDGSGGFMSDFTITGGKIGLNLGNQQFTIRNFRITKAVNAINQLWGWAMTYQNLHISDCDLAYNSSTTAVNTTDPSVGSINIIDSTIENCNTFATTAWTRNSTLVGAGSFMLENVELNNVPVAVQGPKSVYLAGSKGSTTIRSWGQGHRYTPNGPQRWQGPYAPAVRPASLVDGATGRYYSRPKPGFENEPLSSFVSLKSAGAKGDGSTDDTVVIQKTINAATKAGKIVFIDHGNYIITKTITIPCGARIVGESYPVLMAKGKTWSNMKKPVPFIEVGNKGDAGHVELTDFVLSTQGPAPGAIMLQWNIKASQGSGMWEVHVRVGGFAGSQLQVAQCPSTAGPTAACLSSFLLFHVPKHGSGAYVENCWFWTADHDIEDANLAKVNLFSGRGMLIEGRGTTLYGTGAEHNALYQYQFAGARELLATILQSETPYYMPNPDVYGQPYKPQAAWNDPTYETCLPGNCDSFGLRILNSRRINIWGGGFYSFFINNSDDCSRPDNNVTCQSQITSIEGYGTKDIFAAAFNTVKSKSMLLLNGKNIPAAANKGVFPDTIALLKV